MGADWLDADWLDGDWLGADWLGGDCWRFRRDAGAALVAVDGLND